MLINLTHQDTVEEVLKGYHDNSNMFVAMNKVRKLEITEQKYIETVIWVAILPPPWDISRQVNEDMTPQAGTHLKVATMKIESTV